jgi:hypothetical protein
VDLSIGTAECDVDMALVGVVLPVAAKMFVSMFIGSVISEGDGASGPGTLVVTFVPSSVVETTCE